MATVEQTLGQRRVRAAFNPSSDSVVDLLKEKAADFIDYCEDLRSHLPSTWEVGRLISLAQTHAEDAAMWAVKAATTPK